MQVDGEGGLHGEDGDASGDGVALLHARFLAGLGAFAAASLAAALFAAA
jgi:hypothetical protein